MPVSSPPSMTAAPAVPDRADRTTLAARATAFFDYIKNNMVSEIAAAMSYVYGAATTVAGDVAAASASAADATTQAGTATTQAGVATSAAASLTSLQGLWLGSAASDPATGTGGAALVAGNAYVNTATGYLRVYNGSAWVQGVSAVSGVSTVNGASGAITGVATLTGPETLTNKKVDTVTGSAIASASTLNLDAATGNRVHITGTTTITAVMLTRGPRTVIFDGVLTLTHHATTNNLPGAANITTAAGDRAIYESDGTTVYCVAYLKANGQAVAASAGGFSALAIVSSSGTWTVPAGVTRGKLTLIGAGGGPENSTLFDGGWSGSVCIKYLSLTPGATATVVIGAGGGLSAAGGDSTFVYGGVTYTAAGGPRGNATVPTVPTNGDLNIPGAPGGAADISNSVGAAGGQTPGFGGGARHGYSNAGQNANFYGGGGSCHVGVGSGSGFQGVAIIEY